MRFWWGDRTQPEPSCTRLLGCLLQAQAEGGGAGAKEGGLPSIVGSNRPREERDSEAGQQQLSHQLAGQGRSSQAHGKSGV